MNLPTPPPPPPPPDEVFGKGSKSAPPLVFRNAVRPTFLTGFFPLALFLLFFAIATV